MRVLLTSHGSTGDIFPVIALGHALRQQKHQVSFAAPSIFADAIRNAGLDFLALPPHWPQEEFTECMRELDRMSNPLSQLRQIYRRALPHLPETIEKLSQAAQTADLMVGSYLFPGLSMIAQKQGIPFAVITFAHNVVPSPSYPPEQWPRFPWLPQSWQHAYHRLSWKLSDRLVDAALNNVLKGSRRQLALPPVKHFLSQPAPLALVSVSPALMHNGNSIAPPFHFSGYLRWQSPRKPELDPPIQQFCQTEKVPILSFGSVSFDHADALMQRLLQHWPQDKKLIVQRGWAGLSLDSPPPHILCLDAISHDQLFAYASCVIHHGGAGTTASVLHAGVPHIIVPHIADQEFFAAEVKRLKVGLRVDKKQWPEQIAQAVHTIQQQNNFHQQAQQLAQQLAQENGSQQATSLLQEFVDHYHQSTKT